MSVEKSRERLLRLDWTLNAVSLLVVLGLAFTGSFAGYRAFDRMRQPIKRRIAAAEQFARTAQSVKSRNEILSRELSNIESRVTELQAKIPDAAQESDFLAQLAELATRTKLQIRDYRPGGTIEQERHSEMEISLAGNGGYESICRFLSGFESLSRLCKVTNLTISSAGDADQPYPFEMTLQIYFSPAAVRVQNQ